MNTNTESKEENLTETTDNSGHVEPVVSWICCKERLPDDFHNVLVKLDGRIITGAYYAYNGWQPTSVIVQDDVDGNPVIFDFEVTHWMEIPQDMKSN